jgi:glycosyltransferase involved in cell wall biosynthesis
MKTIDIVLPVYNEEAGIASFDAVLRRVLASLRSAYRFRVIYVLDRSPDRSSEIIRSLVRANQDTTLLHMSSRFGHQMALVAGLDHSDGDAVIMMDSDLQHPPELIPSLLAQFELGCDVVQTIRTYGTTISWGKRLTSHLFYWLQNALSPVQIRDGAADFRLASRKVVLVFRRQIREHNQFLRALFQWVGFRTAYVTFVSPPRASGRTSYSVRRLLAFLADGVISFSRLPLRLATVAGLLLSATCILYALYLLLSYTFHGHFPRGYTSLILAMLFIGGLQLMVTGIIGEYVGHIFDEVKARPLYIVDEVLSGGGSE